MSEFIIAKKLLEDMTGHLIKVRVNNDWFCKINLMYLLLISLFTSLAVYHLINTCIKTSRLAPDPLKDFSNYLK
jgi:hypothetical protein